MTPFVGHILTVVAIIASAITPTALAIRWQHSAQMDDNFRLLWNIHGDSITIELQVRTHGYVGIGFARSTLSAGAYNRDGADMIVGWVDRGQTYLQDQHYKFNGAAEPRVDPVDDCQLLLGYENATHTVLRFQRPLDTCDGQHDVAITNSTMRVAYMYHAGEPRWGGIGPGALPQPNVAFRGIVPLQMGQRRHGDRGGRRPTHADDATEAEEEEEVVQVLELRNEEVPLPVFGESLHWCRVFELTEFKRKHHMVRYEPVFGTERGGQLLDQIVLYECQGSALRLSAMARDNGRICGGSDQTAGASARHSRSSVPCNAIVASWTRGSSGLVFPPEAGIPLDSNKERFYMMESHYSNVDANHAPDELLDDLYAGPLLDDSGLRLHVTAQLRPHDAGVLSVGIAADWRHIIPPGQDRFTAEGQCVDACTRNTLPPTGLSVFALLMRTGSLGKAMRVRQIRASEELLPLATDAAVHADYAEYRHIEPAARVLPGDRLVVECTYDSTERETITVNGGGGHRPSGAAGCNVLAVYYPRQKRLTECESLPSLPTVLQSLGIERLSGNPVRIAAPPALAGMTLESRLLGYDWAQLAGEFERVTRAGSFQAVCRDARHKTVLGTDKRLYRPATVRRVWREPTQRRLGAKCAQQRQQQQQLQWGAFDDANEVDEVAMSNSIDGEPNEHDAYVVQSLGLSGGAWKDVRPASLLVLVASMCALFMR